VQEFVSEGQLNAANGQSLISAANNLRSALRRHLIQEEILHAPY
jgi:hypothetical protein